MVLVHASWVLGIAVLSVRLIKGTHLLLAYLCTGIGKKAVSRFSRLIQHIYVFCIVLTAFTGT